MFTVTGQSEGREKKFENFSTVGRLSQLLLKWTLNTEDMNLLTIQWRVIPTTVINCLTA